MQIKFDGVGFFDFFKRSKAKLTAIAKNNRVRSDSGGQQNFTVWKSIFDVGGDGTQGQPLAVDARLGIAKVVVGKGFNNNNIRFLGKKRGDVGTLVLVIVFETEEAVFDIASAKTVI